jgi:hypothetical protein
LTKSYNGVLYWLFFESGFKAVVAVHVAPSAILVTIIFIILAVSLQLWWETLDMGNMVKKTNKRNKMKTRKSERKTNGKLLQVTKAAIKVAATITTGIAGRCLLP